ncbi:DUF695 domain-containing protein [Chitinophaga deserti]|uniref:DUF695 domain-containing protein n=1 Tax=Chitinophaga deserti TaxID=2164099 RepID=UPI001300A715|nr:DUF695 domain-containing protein [Chitinophaga deserti]
MQLKQYLLPVAMLISQAVWAQQAVTGTGKSVPNTLLKGQAPDEAYPFLVVTELTLPGCKGTGLTAEQEETHASISESASRQMQLLTRNEEAGYKTEGCKRIDFYYVSDTLDLRMVMNQFYKDNYGTYPHSVSIRPDPGWKAYLGLLEAAGK